MQYSFLCEGYFVVVYHAQNGNVSTQVRWINVIGWFYQFEGAMYLKLVASKILNQLRYSQFPQYMHKWTIIIEIAMTGNLLEDRWCKEEPMVFLLASFATNYYSKPSRSKDNWKENALNRIVGWSNQPTRRKNGTCENRMLWRKTNQHYLKGKLNIKTFRITCVEHHCILVFDWLMLSDTCPNSNQLHYIKLPSKQNLCHLHRSPLPLLKSRLLNQLRNIMYVIIKKCSWCFSAHFCRGLLRDLPYFWNYKFNRTESNTSKL